MTDIQALFWLAGLAAAYFLPAIAAWLLKHPNAAAIFILNLFLGWTFFGWVIALVWAFITPKKGTT